MKARLKSVFLRNLEESLGIVSLAAEKTGIDRSTVYRWLKKDAKFKRKFEEVLQSSTEKGLDVAEISLINEIQRGNFSAIRFYLLCKGAHRGWKNVEKVDVSVEIPKPIVFRPFNENIVSKNEINDDFLAEKEENNE